MKEGCKTVVPKIVWISLELTKKNTLNFHSCMHATPTHLHSCLHVRGSFQFACVYFIIK